MSTWRFTTHRDVIPVYSFAASELDPNWEYVDAAGCIHKGNNLAATIIQVQDKSLFYDDGDGYYDEVSQSHYECILCKEHIVPGYRTIRQPQFVNGMKTITATSPAGESFSLELEEIELYQAGKVTELIALLEDRGDANDTTS